MDFRNCIICKNNDNLEKYCEQDGQIYVRCNSCKLVYVNTFASQGNMNKAYTGGGLKSLRRRLFGPFRRMHHMKGAKDFTLRAAELFEFAKSAYNKPVENIKFIDVGCNKGFLLEQAHKNGADVYGVELVKEVMTPFKNTYPALNERVFHERFSNVAWTLDSECFDIITSIDVIEHFEDPLSDLKHIYRALKNDGVFVIQTPDVESQDAIEQKCTWGGLKPLEHLHLFGRTNFVTFAKDVGFSEVTVHDPIEHGDGNFMAVMKK